MTFCVTIELIDKTTSTVGASEVVKYFSIFPLFSSNYLDLLEWD